jgi:hypothetical protein
MKLSPGQVNIIRELVEKGGIKFELLKEDVIDHLCCVVESEVDRAKTFEIALQEAIIDLAPDGLEEIQRETVFLLNSTKIIRMKKIMYGIGLLSAISFVLGWAFGILHLPGAKELSINGFLGFVFVFVPLLAIDRFKSNIRWLLSDKLKFILGTLSALLIAAAMLFKIMHLPGADELFFAGAVLLAFGFLPFLFFTMYKKSIS